MIPASRRYVVAEMNLHGATVAAPQRSAAHAKVPPSASHHEALAGVAAQRRCVAAKERVKLSPQRRGVDSSPCDARARR